MTHKMDAFLEAFCALDQENREVISVEDLRRYNRKNNLTDGFPETFMRVFDSEKTGNITLEQYCRTLGLVPKQFREFRRRRTTQLYEHLLPPDLEIVHDDMDLEIKVKVLECFVDDLRESGRRPNINVEKLDTAIRRLKEYLERRHGKTWHIIVSVNQHLAWFSYCPGYMFHFCLGRFAVLIWKTPCI
ncbi:unnamed protein product [Calicophoron daubneyi]|uniref:Tegument antigen n=1 Tax=Calicophoron daubneyi TaxID=300641 RepID=A0AAV2TC06_CALDB